MIRLVKHLDANLDEIEDEDDLRADAFARNRRAIVEDKGRVSVPLMLMDSRAAAAALPAGKYFKIDNCGRVHGIGDIAGELRRVQAGADSAYARYVAPRLVPMRDGKPDPWRFYRDWQLAHGNL